MRNAYGCRNGPSSVPGVFHAEFVVKKCFFVEGRSFHRSGAGSCD